ncbi:hypothetical protein MRX96_027238 [Rhipicephalus microplus]
MHEADQLCVSRTPAAQQVAEDTGRGERSTLPSSNRCGAGRRRLSTCALDPLSLVLAHYAQSNRGCKAQSRKALNKRMLRNGVELIMTRPLQRGRAPNRRHVSNRG